MVGKTKSSSSSAATSFVELEPYCEWQKEEGFETLIIHLPGMPSFFSSLLSRVKVSKLVLAA